jgi:PAS domain S-box-containing protein
MSVARDVNPADVPLDVTMRQFVERAAGPLAAGDDFFQGIVDALPAAIYTTDASGRLTYFNEAAVRLWGRRPVLGESRWCGSWKLFWPDGRTMPHDRCPMSLALKEGRAVYGMEAVAERPDGSRIPFLPYPTPIRDSTGRIIGAVNMLLDISERRRAEEALLHLAAIVESSDDAIVSKNLDGTITSWNIGAERIFGFLAEEAIGRSISILIPPDRRKEEETILDRIRRGQRIDHYETVRQRKHGGLIDVSLTVSPIKNDQGRIIGASKIARDITERKRRDAQIITLAREAEHRSRNILATVQATVRLSQADSAEELKQVLLGRIEALTNVNSLLVQSRWTGAELRSLVTQELMPYSQGRGSRALIEGPELTLAPSAAQAIAISLHELATNAAKYGSLSVADGHVRIAWSRTADAWLRLRWSETGGPPVRAPTRQGFGTRVVENVIAGQLGGDVRFTWDTQGLTCDIAFRMD